MDGVTEIDIGIRELIDGVDGSADSWDVILTDEEFKEAVRISELRISEARRLKCKEKYDYDRDHKTDGDDGAVAELAVCKYLNIEWSKSVNTFKSVPDVICDNLGIEVRGTRIPNGRLIFRDDDFDDRFYLLVIVSGRKCRIVGGLPGAKCRHKRFRTNFNNNRCESYGVDQSFLSKIRDRRPK